MLKKRNRKIKILVFGLVGAMMLSIVQLPKVYAEDSCFVSADAINRVDDPYRSGNILIPVDATCAMKLYSMDVSFLDADNVDGLNAGHSTYWHDGISSITDDGAHIAWNTDESDLETRDGRPYIDVEAGDSLFGYWYDIPLETEVFKHNMAVTINSARYEINGEMKTVENLVLDAIVTITPDEAKDVLMISGVEKQDVSYTGQPVVIEGELTVEENNDGITADDLTEKYYIYDDSDSSFTPIERPTDPGEFYLVEYSFENDNYRALLRVPFTIKDYYTVSHHIDGGEGEISTPAYVDAGGDLHVDIIPADGFKVSWVDYNRQDVTNLLNDDNSLDITSVNEDVEIVVSFIHSYQVTQGNGGTHTIGDNDDLSFVVDKDPHSYTEGDVLVTVDEDYVELRTNSTVNPEAQTTTLLSHYLDTLEPGEHKLEIFFFDTEPLGIAEATFMIVEANPEESAEDGDDETIVVPNTGLFTGENGSSFDAMGIAVLVGVITSGFGFVPIRKMMRRSK